jgi:mevalonate kinase
MQQFAANCSETSELTVGAGLGSSAAHFVCLAAAIDLPTAGTIIHEEKGS